MAAKPICLTDEDDDDKRVYKTKKVLCVDSHGVKNFPCFGLTIFQFEKEFKACIERRKQNGPQILNILFPMKTGNRYLEYLENIQSQQTGK